MFPGFGNPVHQFLAAQPWFVHQDTALQSRLLDGCTVLSGDKGSVLLASGEPVAGWYAVLSGLVKLQRVAPGGRVSVFLGAPAGEWFGEGSALKEERRRYEVVALRDTRLLCLPRALFDELRGASLSFNQYLVDHLNLRLGQAMAAIESGRIRSPRQRVAVYLSGQFWRGARRLDLTQDEIGQLSGLSRQSVNRALRELEHAGLVALDFGRVRILDETALRDFIAQPDGGIADVAGRGDPALAG